MSDKEADRSRREKRRGQQSREKDARRAAQARTANLESKAKNKKENLDLKIVKLVDKGYSIASVAKRLGLTVRRINMATDAVHR
jgi:rRNA maturation endonuclease Nob1